MLSLVMLTSGMCTGDNIDGTFDDEAALPAETSCSSGTPALPGTFQPYAALTAFDGQIPQRRLANQSVRPRQRREHRHAARLVRGRHRPDGGQSAERASGQ